MAGWVLRPLPKSDFDFSDWGANASGEVVLAEACDVLDADAAQLVVRVWSATVGGGASLKVVARKSCPTDEDPSSEFTVSGDDTEAAITTTSGPRVVYADVARGEGLGPYLRVVLQASQGATVATIQATIGVDIAVRD